MALYGAAGIGLDFTGYQTLPVKDDFTTLGTSSGVGWTVGAGSTSLVAVLDSSYAGAVPAGSTVDLQAGPGSGWSSADDTYMINYGVAQTALAASNVTTYTITWRIAANWTAGQPGVADLSVVPQNALRWEFQVNSTYVSNGGSSASPWSYAVAEDQNWHVYVFCVTKGASASTPESIDVYRDTVKLGTFQGGGSTGWTSQLEVDSFAGSLLLHMDYFYVDAGLNPPNQPPQTGSVTVNVQYVYGASTNPLSGISVTFNGVAKTADINGQASWTNVAVGSYTLSVSTPYVSGSNTYVFSSWSDGGAVSHTVTLTSNGLSLTASFSVQAPTTGSLAVNATYGGNLIAVNVYTVSPSPQSETGTTTTDPNNPLIWTGLTPGTYTVTGTYSGNSPSASAAVVAGQTGHVSLDFDSPPATTGTLNVFAKYQGNFIAVSVTVNGLQSTTGTTHADGSALSLTLDASSSGSTYSVSATYNSIVQIAYPVVTSGQTSACTLTFTGTPTTYTLLVLTQNSLGQAITGLTISAAGQTFSSPATFSGIAAGASVTVSAPSSDGSGNAFEHWTINGDSTTYTSPTATFTMNSGMTIVATYAGTSTGGPNWGALEQEIISLLNNSNVMKLELIMGILALAVSTIMLFVPAAKKPQPQYYITQ